MSLLQRHPAGPLDRALPPGFGVLLAVILAFTAFCVALAWDAAAPARDSLLAAAAAGAVSFIAGCVTAARAARSIAASQKVLQLENELARVTLHSIGDGVITADAE